MTLDIRQLAKGKRISDFDDLGWHDAPLDEVEEVDIRRLRRYTSRYSHHSRPAEIIAATT